MDILGLGLGSKKTSEAGVWVDDSEAKHCVLCKTSFGLITRKHHCRQCGQVVCNECSQNRKFLESSRTGMPKRVCDTCWTKGSGGTSSVESATKAMAGASLSESGGAGSPDGSARKPAASPRVPEVPREEAVQALQDHPFEGRWQFDLVFLQVDLGAVGAPPPMPGGAAAAAALGSFKAGGAAGAKGKAGSGSARGGGAWEPVREGSKVPIALTLKTKGAAYFQGECGDFGQFGSEGKVTGAVQRANGKASATIQMVNRVSGPTPVTTSFNFTGYTNKDGMYSGTWSACEISKNAGSCSGIFKARRVGDAVEAAGGAAAEGGAGAGASGEDGDPSASSGSDSDAAPRAAKGSGSGSARRSAAVGSPRKSAASTGSATKKKAAAAKGSDSESD